MMEIKTRTASGTEIRLTIELDKHGIHQIFARFIPEGEIAEIHVLCNGWGRRKTPQGLREGIIVKGQVIDIPKKEWLGLFLEREDLNAGANLENIHLVRVFSKGDRMTIDGYTLSAPVDRKTWRLIAPLMSEVDSSENEILVEGDHFVGWVVSEGKEQEVEEILEVKPEYRVFRGSLNR